MRSVNKIILVGVVVADPEVRRTAKGTTVATFPLATHREFTSENEPKNVTDYHRIVAWAKLGDTCGTYIEKGKTVYVEGMILNRAYEKNGERLYVTEIRAEEIHTVRTKRHDGSISIGREPLDA